ncbi:hypothetical protein SSX86_001246 [Deinandra increscens subsp. villosa]|uniref:RRM domain-containing protein n=1 Tax=Deinandra increscens subsp. villosa TaxID=3103831 RepID=A0AAP0H912_9ASTR
MSNDLSEELFVEIFSRLPSKPLLRFRSLSKWSYARIGSPDFIRLHTLRSKNKVIFMHTTFCQNHYIDHPKEPDVYTLHSEDQLPYDHHIYKTRVHHPFKDYKIIGSCNGILCIYERGNRRNGSTISLWNPSIRRKLTVPVPHFDHDTSDFGFGYDPVIEDYKILKLSRPTPFLYTMKTRTWRKIGSPPTYPYYVVDSFQCLFNGALYYAITVDSEDCYDSYIMRFDLSSEVFTIIKSPQPSSSWRTRVVTIINGCLAVISGKDEVSWIWVRNADSSWFVGFVLDASDCGGTRRAFHLTAIGGLLLEREIYENVVIDPETDVKSRLADLSDSSYINGMSMFTESLGLVRIRERTPSLSQMGKKPKDFKPETPDSSASSHNIFKSLFATNLQQPNDPSSVSIFSDSTPFRTKLTDESHKLQQVLRLDVDSPQKPHPQIPNSSNKLPIKRKRNDSDIELDVKKSKVESVTENGDTSDNNNKKKKKKKKRKRAEIEAEYEEIKYKGVDLNSKKDEGVQLKIGEKRKELDKVELDSKEEGFDDEEKLLRTVFVGNLPLKVKKKALLREFNQFGEIESIRIRSVPLLDDKTPRKGAVIKKHINDAVDRVNAYIVFKMEDSAQASLSHNMAVVGGNHIHVDRACPPRKKLKGEDAPLYDIKRTVFIGNLPFDVKDEELYQLFSGINNLKDCIEAIRVVRDPGTSMGKGIAYILFTTREAANTVVRKHNLKIRDRELRLSRTMKTNANMTPSKRKESSTPEKYNSSKKAAVGGDTSYQGIQATKSGGQKKFATRIAKLGGTDSGSENAVKRKVRSDKRPAVAARKAAANASGIGGDVGSSGAMKRKPENRTPQSVSRNKKPRKF